MNANAITTTRSRSTRTWLVGAAILLVGAVGAAAVVLSTTNRTEIHSSRAVQYTSLEQLRGDSVLIAEGRVTAQEEGSIPTYAESSALPTTVSQFDVRQGTNLVGGQADSSFGEGQTIRIAQIGTTADHTEVPLLSEGTEYLLFLVLDKSGDYFITGASAGMYETGGDGTYKPSYAGLDEIPDTLQYAEAVGR